MPTKWEQAAARLHKKIKIVVEFDNSDGALIPRICTSNITVPIEDARKLLIGVGRTSGSVNPKDCTAQIRGTSITIMDKDAFFTRLINTYEIRERIASIYVGFDNMREDQYQIVFKGKVSGMRCSRPGQWTLNLSDIRRSLKNTIFTNATEASPQTYTDVNPIDFLIARLNTDDSTGLNIPYGLIDQEGMLYIRDTYFSGLEFSFSIPEPKGAKEWLEQEICRPLGLYFSTLPGGSLTLVKVSAPTSLEAANFETIDEDDIIAKTPVTVSLDLRDLLNELKWEYDWDTVDEEFDTTTYYLDSDSVTAFDQTRNLSIASEGLTTADILTITTRNSQIFARFADPYPRYKMKTTLRLARLQPGSLVAIKPKNTPDVESGLYVWPSYRFCEVLSVSADWKHGTVALELIGTPFDDAEKTATISALSIDYATATAPQRLAHAWVGRAADNKVFDGADWVDGYVILDG